MRNRIAALRSLAALVVLTAGAAADPTASRPSGIVKKNVAYGDDPRQALDLYCPASPGFATVVYTYGGGWHAGSNKSSTPIAQMFQRHGIGCVLVNHRLSPAHRFPAHADDVAAAFAWTLKNIGAYGGDAKRVYLAGHSSGAHLSLLLATDPKYLARHERSVDDIRGVIGLSTPVDLAPHADGKGFGDALLGGRGADAFNRDVALMKSASPIQHVSQSLPRTLLIVGEHDFPMLEDDAHDFARQAKRTGATVKVMLARNCDHMGVARAILDENGPVLKRVLAFIRGPVSRSSASTRPSSQAIKPASRSVLQ